MRRMRAEELIPGAVFEHDVLDTHGRVMLRAGVIASPEMLESLRACAEAGVFENDHRPTRLHEERSVQHEERDSGERAVGDGETDDDRELLRRAVNHLRERALVQSRLRAWGQTLLDSRRPRWTALERRILPTAGALPATGAISVEALEDHAQTRQERIGVLRRLLGRLAVGEGVGPATLMELVDELMDEAARRPGMLTTSALGLGALGFGLAEHCFATGALSLSMALELGWCERDARAACIAGLLSDSGMALVPMPVRSLDRPLSDEELNAMRRHTTWGVALAEMLRAATGDALIEERVLLAIFQHHERCDASGYPNRERAHAIHDLAKIVGVADAFVAAITPRAHRFGMARPAALAQIIRQAQAGVFDVRCARALLLACGVYPPGSALRLSDGHDAIVLGRGARETLDRPIVRLTGRGGMMLGASGLARQPVSAAHGETIDLAWYRASELAVA